MSTLLTLREAAAFLRCSCRSIQRRVREPKSKLPAVKIGGKWLFDSADLQNWLERKKDETKNIYQREAA